MSSSCVNWRITTSFHSGRTLPVSNKVYRNSGLTIDISTFYLELEEEINREISVSKVASSLYTHHARCDESKKSLQCRWRQETFLGSQVRLRCADCLKRRAAVNFFFISYTEIKNSGSFHLWSWKITMNDKIPKNKSKWVFFSQYKIWMKSELHITKMFNV